MNASPGPAWELAGQVHRMLVESRRARNWLPGRRLRTPHCTDAASPQPAEPTVVQSRWRIDDFDREIVHFVLEWAPFGGAADEDAFTRFGLDWSQLCERVGGLVGTAAVKPRLHPEDRILLARAGAVPHGAAVALSTRP